MKVFLVSLCFFLQFFNSYAQLQLNSYPSAIQIISGSSSGYQPLNYTNPDNGLIFSSFLLKINFLFLFNKALVIDGNYAVGINSGGPYDTIEWYSFNNSDIPLSSTINNINVVIAYKCNLSNSCSDKSLYLVVNGTSTKYGITSTCWPTKDNEITYTFNNPSVTPNDLSSNTKVQFTPSGYCTSRNKGTPYIDGMYLVLYYTLPTTTVLEQTTQQTNQQQTTQQLTTQGSKQQSTTQGANLQTTTQGTNLQTTTQGSKQQSTTQGSTQQTTQESNQQITNTQAFTTPHSNNTISIALGVVFGLIGLFCIICIIILIIFYRKRKSNSETIDLHPVPENQNSNISSSSNPSSGYKDVPLSQFLAHISNLLEEDPITQKKEYELEYRVNTK